jgi:hypothetical protein
VNLARPLWQPQWTDGGVECDETPNQRVVRVMRRRSHPHRSLAAGKRAGPIVLMLLVAGCGSGTIAPPIARYTGASPAGGRTILAELKDAERIGKHPARGAGHLRGNGPCRTSQHPAGEPAAPMLPAGASTLELCLIGGLPGQAVLTSVQVRSARVIAELTRELNALPGLPGAGLIRCPMDDGSAIQVAAYYRTRAPLFATVDRTGCMAVARGRMVRQGSAALVENLEGLLG